MMMPVKISVIGAAAARSRTVLEQRLQPRRQPPINAADDMAFQPIGLDHPPPIHRFRQADRQIASLVHAAGGGAADGFAQAPHRPGDGRQHQQRLQPNCQSVIST